MILIANPNAFLGGTRALPAPLQDLNARMTGGEHEINSLLKNWAGARPGAERVSFVGQRHHVCPVLN